MDSIKIKNSSPSFAVSNIFVDKHMKEANASYVKVYLYILRHSNFAASLSLKTIADNCGLLQSDVVSAFKYWAKEGVLSYSENEIVIYDLSCGVTAYVQDEQENISDELPAVPEKKFQPNNSVASNYKASDVIKTVSTNDSLAHMFAIISQLLNKSLTPTDYKIIYSFIDYLNLPEPVIIMLFEYCISNGKTAIRYIEKIAYSWADNGITTPEEAVRFIKHCSDEKSVLTQYRRRFKISGRDFSETEENMLLTWINECKASEELIMRAYETTVMNTGKVSFKYMDAIIRDELSRKESDGEKPLSSNIRKSTFRNYPSENSISETEKKMIQKMMSQYGGNSDADDK